MTDPEVNAGHVDSTIDSILHSAAPKRLGRTAFPEPLINKARLGSSGLLS